MKKTFTLGALLFCVFTAVSQIVNIPDANFKAKLLSASPSNSTASSDSTFTIDNAIPSYVSVNSNHTIDTNSDGEIQVSEALAIKYLNLNVSGINNLTGIEEFKNLEYLYCINNHITNLNLQGLNKLKYLICLQNQMTTLNLQGLSNLLEIDCSMNQISNLNLQSSSNLKYLKCNSNYLTILNLQGHNKLIKLLCENNHISLLNIQGANNLLEIYCSNNNLVDLNLQGLNNLESLVCWNNPLTSLNIESCTNIRFVQCLNNQLANLNFQGLTKLSYLSISGNQLTSLNLEDCSELTVLDCASNQLTSINIKNNSILNQNYIEFYSNPNLKYICCDDSEVTAIQSKITSYGYTNCEVNSYCSFVPGGTYYSIKGNTKFDFNNNSCDTNDIAYPNMKFKITNGSVIGGIVANTSGNYSIAVGSGTHTITPQLENPTYFTVSPPSFQTTFTSTSVVTSVTQNFCIAPNGVHQDLEIVIVPVTPARPGFEATYKIVYKNKGNVVIPSGQVAMEYLPNFQSFVSAVPAVASTNTGFLYWNYTNLQPFETRTITVILKNNKPTDTPPLVGGDLLQFIVKITPEVSDYCSQYTTQTVVNSFDPNDKTLLEGKTITTAMIGKYVHYVIRFENTGTAPAQNIVVKDIIDTTKFDVSTLIPMNSSHDYVTRITDTNKVEFIFEGINLPFDDANNDGYIMFKIKLKDNLTVGNSFSNLASIYFDYNKPIITNTETTSIVALANPSFDFETNISLCPNPTKSTLNISTKNNTTLNSIEIYNTIGQIILSIPNTENQRTIDVSSLTLGTYFIKVHTDKGTSSAKFVVQ